MESGSPKVNERILPILTPQFPDWPEPVDCAEFENEAIEKPNPLVENLLDAGSRMIFGGGSKTYKTWALGDMAIAISSGVAWWGFPTFQAHCMYINFELKRFYMQKRFRAIRKAKGVKSIPGQLTVWNLRGYEITLVFFVQTLIKMIREKGISVVFIDPFYKLLGDKDERISADLNQILVAFDEINRVTDATVIFAAHFTKGNQAGKEHIDRISGGGSIGRDADSLMTLTNHEEPHAFAVEFTVRDFPPINSFVVKWDHPLLVRTDLDPGKLKTATRGRPACDPQELFRIISENDDLFSTPELTERAIDELGWSKRTVLNKLHVLKGSKRVWLSAATEKWNVRGGLNGA